MQPVCVIKLDDWHGLAQAKVVMKALSAAGSISLFVGAVSYTHLTLPTIYSV